MCASVCVYVCVQAGTANETFMPPPPVDRVFTVFTPSILPHLNHYSPPYVDYAVLLRASPLVFVAQSISCRVCSMTKHAVAPYIDYKRKIVLPGRRELSSFLCARRRPRGHAFNVSAEPGSQGRSCPKSRAEGECSSTLVKPCSTTIVPRD